MSLCPDVVADGNYKDFGEVLTKLVDTIGMYNECAAKHDAIVAYERKKK